jgi:hypothetical protein
MLIDIIVSMDLRLINHDSTDIKDNIKYFKADDRFIHLEAHNKFGSIFKKKLGWIPFNQFCDIKYITEGNFKKMYKANWIKEYKEWDYDGEKRKSKCRSMMFVILKSLDDLDNAAPESIIKVC